MDFTVLGSFPRCFSNGDFPLFFLLTLSAYRISDSPDLSLVKTICLFALSRSLIVLISLSIFLFPIWSLSGHVSCSIPNCLQNCVNASLTKTVPGSVRILLGTPYCAIYCFKNSITFFVMGRCKNFASGYPEKWSLDISNNFFPFFAFWNGPAKSSVLFILLFACGNCPVCDCFRIHFRFLPDRRHCSHNRGWSITSMWIRGHQISVIIDNMTSLPGWP